MGLKGDLVKQYIEKFHDTPNLTLAKLIYKDNPEVYKDLEATRRVIRTYKGQAGKYNRKAIVDKRFYGPPGTTNPFDDLPEGLKYYDEWEPYKIRGKNILVISDIHIPYHAVDPLRIALEYGKSQEVDTVLINGDLVDFYQISYWQADPRNRDFAHEIEQIAKCLKVIRNGFPNAEIILKIGNHEERYERYMKVKAPELLKIEAFDEFTGLWNKKDGSNVFRDCKIKVIGDKRIVKIGKLNVIHGHEFGRTMWNPVNPARGLYLKGKELALCGHYHQTSSHTEKTMEDKIIATWSIGALCNLRPEYKPINPWNYGFCIVRRESDRDFEIDNKKIIDGKIYTG